MAGMSESRIPRVDVSPWFLEDGGSRAAVASSLDAAFRTAGFAVVVGHKVPPATTEGALRAAVEFFNGSGKASCAAAANLGAPGYRASGGECVSQLLGDFSRPPDRVEGFVAKCLHDERRSAAVWPSQTTVDLKDAALRHHNALQELWGTLMAIAERALRASPGGLGDAYDVRRSSSYQLARYLPPCEGASDDVVFGAHTDSGGLTLLQSTAPGLEVLLPDGHWHAVPSGLDRSGQSPVVVNVGRILARHTNDTWLAAIHRVRAAPEPKLTAVLPSASGPSAFGRERSRSQPKPCRSSSRARGRTRSSGRSAPLARARGIRRSSPRTSPRRARASTATGPLETTRTTRPSSRTRPQVLKPRHGPRHKQ